MTAQIKITQLTEISTANLVASALLPVVNMTGVPTTQKATFGNVANVILSGAGSDYNAAGLANLAYSVVNAAQPNITSVGTLTTLTVSGNINLGAVANVKINGGSNGQVLTTDGAGNLSWTAASSYSNSNVETYLPTYAGNVGANWILADYVSGNASPLFYIPGANVVGAVPYAATANSVAVANVSGLGNIATVNLDGNASNVLHGDGSWSADITNYGNSNVVSLLSAFGSNTITTTGDVSVGNIAATNLGNVAFVNFDGNSSNVLYGNGVFDGVGSPFNQDLNTTDNVTFANITSTDAIRFSNSGNIVGALGYAPNYVSIEGYGSNTVNITANDIYTWSFDGNGNLSVPVNINFNGGGIQQVTNEDFYVRVSDAENDGWALYNVVDDGAGNNLARTELQRGSFRITTDITGSSYEWLFDNGQLNLPGNINGIYGGNTSLYAYDNGSGGMVEIKTISYIGDTLLSNVTVAQNNVSISTSNAAYTWKFDYTGNLNLPGNTFSVNYANGAQVTLGGLPLANGTSNINIATANGAVTLTADGSTWAFDPSGQLTLPNNQGIIYSPSGSDLRILNNQNAGFMQLGWQDGAVLTPGANLAANVTLNSTGVTITTTNDTYTTTNNWLFGVDGILTLPSGTGNEGAEIQFAQAPNSTLSGNTITVDSYVDQIRIFESGGTNRGVYIDLTQAGPSVSTLLNNRVSGIVNSGTFVTMDNLKATVTTTGNRGLSLATLSGTAVGYASGSYVLISGSPAGTASSISLTTTAGASLFNWNFTGEGDTATYVIRDNTNNRVYRITLMIGGSYNNNFISIERLL